MVASTKANGSTGKLLVKAGSGMPTATNMKVNGPMIKQTATASTHTRTVHSISAIGSMTFSMDTGERSGLMGALLKVTMCRGRKMGREPISGLMGVVLRVGGKIIK